MKEHVLEQKKQVVQEIKEKLEKSESIVLMDYKGLNVADVTDLRKQCRENNVEYKVYKNTMLRFALHEFGVEGLDAVSYTHLAIDKICQRLCAKRCL